MSIWTKKKPKGAPHLPAERTKQGDFSFGGHRLSSLYRDIEIERKWLRNS